MVVNTTPLKFSKRKEGRVEKKDDGSERRRLTLKERQEKVYPFPDSDIVDMLEQLLEKQLIQLPKCKRPKQAGKVDDPNYFKYHQVISHPVEKCFVLKELILGLAREKKIELDLEEVAQTNHVVVTIMSEALSPRLIFEQRESLVQFGTFEPIVVQFHQEVDENLEVVACHAINATKEETASSSSAPTATYESTPYCMSIDFSDEDLLMGSKLHNQPLYVSGYVREQRVDWILINNGSTVNMMSKSTMRQLGILMNELSNSKLVIQGFNQGSQRVIDGVKKVEADSNSFLEAESHFTDAKFYLKNDNSSEAVRVEIPLVNREDNLQLKSLASREPHKSTGTFNFGKGESSTSTTKSMILMDEKTSNPPILHYVPLSRRKKGESPFVESPQGLKVGKLHYTAYQNN
ncbi:retrotransposon gag protein [Cucumis melo var. makuwa]|uniref:Retrotransposon gag protein n=1 Tax=Cucumis melo var. makuwa TaxID=1194695 RepID=A0A5A7T7Z3_CUCMM|nr:retrotransposon gag protein [Cucumis melo var. makuwa]TYK01718.1 retrotransposon gag protein [Cucumis melo var. makuwa]